MAFSGGGAVGLAGVCSQLLELSLDDLRRVDLRLRDDDLDRVLSLRCRRERLLVIAGTSSGRCRQHWIVTPRRARTPQTADKIISKIKAK